MIAVRMVNFRSQITGTQGEVFIEAHPDEFESTLGSAKEGTTPAKIARLYLMK